MKVPPSLELSRLRVQPLRTRRSLTRVDEILIAPETPPAPFARPETARQVRACADQIRRAREAGAAVILLYGAHLLRNGAARIVEELLRGQWITHLATNGAGSIHDWEYAWLGASTEAVEENVSTGTFGVWEETSRYIHAALLSGALRGLGYGASVGAFIHEDGAHFPALEALRDAIVRGPDHRLTSARADLLCAYAQGHLSPGKLTVEHRWPHASIFAAAWRHGVPLTVHPGIGYDIISNHPMFSGSVLGRAAETDFKVFGAAVEKLEGGVVLSVGSAVMGPQVFEKSLSCVNNLRLGEGRKIVHGHSVFVVDLQDGGGWDWTQGEPPKTHPAYYLRFCKSFSRMGAPMNYIQADNATFVHALWHALRST
jgi:hypothetical protein